MTLLFFLIPPILGAIIGWVTNALAIKMLFRPLKPYYIGRLRSPFTPGILPRQRDKLARNIGRMVRRELITEEVLQERLSDEIVGQPLKEIISRWTGRIGSLSPKELWRAMSHFIYLRTEKAAPQFFSDFTKNILPSSTLEGLLTRTGEQIWPPLMGKLEELLNSEGFRKEAEKRGRFFLMETIEKLNSMQRLFVALGNYEETLSERMGEIIDSLVSQFLDFLSGEGGRALVFSHLSALVLPYFSKEEGSEEALPIVLTLEKWCMQRSEKSLIEYIPALENLFTLLETKAVDFALDFVRKKIPLLLKRLDIEEIVVKRIDSLEMIEVERIVLDVLANQLKWINVFGAILGALIGAVQILINLFF